MVILFHLIKLKKEVGFINIDNIGPLSIPSFLRWKIKQGGSGYTYVPDVSYDQQPYYYMREEEVIKNPSTGKPVLIMPGTPDIDFGTGMVRDVFGPITLPPSMYWVMGDSRKNSRDSRYWGLLDGKLIHGRASFVIYSVDSEEPFWLFDLIKHPVSFWIKHVRWGRFLNGLSDKKSV